MKKITIQIPKKDVPKLVIRIITFLITFILFPYLAYYGLCKHEEYPDTTIYMIINFIFLAFWWGGAADWLIHTGEFGNMRARNSDPVDKDFVNKYYKK